MPVTPIGARRRITALFWLGWSPPVLAEVTGLPEAVFRYSRYDMDRSCGQDVLDRIGATYELLWNTAPPTRTADERRLVEVTARHARQVGWAPPMAYDDDEIDQPDGGPVPGWKRSKSARPRDRSGLIEDIEFLRDAGYRQATPAELSDRLGHAKEAMGRAICRHRRAQRQAAEAELTGPDRTDWEATA